MINIEKVITFPFTEFARLKEESLREGFRFLQRIETEWVKGNNQFDKTGEGLFVLLKQGKIIGIGGINQSPYAPTTSKIARLRRFYISQNSRRKGYGTLLVKHLIRFAAVEFKLLQLKTDSKAASIFYKSIGFEKMEQNLNITHQLDLWIMNDE